MWQTPKMDWNGSDAISYEPFKRIEENIQYLKELLG